MHIAADYDEVEAVRLLLAAKASVAARTREGGTALHVACQIAPRVVRETALEMITTTSAGSLTVQQLVDELANFGAMDHGRLKTSLQSGTIRRADKGGIRCQCRYGERSNATHGMRRQRQNKGVESLLRAGADLHGRSSDGKTALHYAATGSTWHATKYRRAVGEWKLESHYSFGNSLVIRVLLETGADLSAKDTDGKTPIEIAQHSNKQYFETYLKN